MEREGRKVSRITKLVGDSLPNFQQETGLWCFTCSCTGWKEISQWWDHPRRSRFEQEGARSLTHKADLYERSEKWQHDALIGLDIHTIGILQAYRWKESMQIKKRQLAWHSCSALLQAQPGISMSSKKTRPVRERTGGATNCNGAGSRKREA